MPNNDHSDLGFVPAEDHSDIGFVPSEKSEPEVSAIESGMRGLLDPATLGFYKSAEAGINAATQSPQNLQDLYGKYQQALAQSKEREEAAFKQHPYARYAGMAGSLLVPTGEALGAAGLIGKAAEGAGALSKIGTAAKNAAVVGGLYGVGSSGKSLPNIGVSDVAAPAIGGGLIGGGLGALGVGAASAAESLADKSIPLISKVAQRYTAGLNGTNLYNAAQLAKNTAESASELGESGIANGARELSGLMTDVIGQAEKSGKQVDFSNVMSKLNDLKEQMNETENPKVQSELQDLISYVEDRILGAKQNRFGGQLPPEEAKSLESDLGKRIYGEQAFETPDVQKAAQGVDQLVTEGVNRGIPGYEPLRAKDAMFKQAMQRLGLPANTANDLMAKTASGDKVLDPDMAKKIENLFRSALSNPHEAENVQMGLDMLKKAGFEGIDELVNNLQSNLNTEDLGAGLPSARSMVNPIGGYIFKGMKAVEAVPNIAGLAQERFGQAAEDIGTKTGIAGQLGGMTEDFLGNKVKQERKDTPDQFSRSIYSMDNAGLANISNTLKGTEFSHIGDSLEQAIQNNDVPKKNAIAFIISTNPKIREAIQGKPLEGPQ